MTTMTLDSQASRLRRTHGEVIRKSRMAAFWPLTSLGIVLGYLVYAWIAFDVSGVFGAADWNRGVLLSRDSFHHKYQVSYSARQDEVSVTVEGDRNTEQDPLPSWVTTDGDRYRVSLGGRHIVTFATGRLDYTAPDGSTYAARVTKDGVHVNGYRAFLDDDNQYRYVPEEQSGNANALDMAEMVKRGILPEGSSFAPTKFEYAPDFYKTMRVTRAQILVQRYFFGWEYFWFGPNSQLHGLSTAALWDLAWSEERIDPALSNAEFIFLEFWRNPDWQHNEMFIALLETLLMALLGTFVAAGVGLPLGFLAAANFNPIFASRMVLRRLFDFLRGIDQIIWSLIFIRAFGLGPLTGSLAIAFTDTGTLGKLFSEAIENIDSKQVEGVRSTGATAIQRYRFGVIPQILPIFVSQTLYYLESNIRSATVIGALGAGGIGLKLVQSMQTQQDWENVMYLIVMTLIVVVSMDIASGWLRRKLINDRG